MPEPSLQDILSMRPDPELATGNTGIVYDTKDLVHTLNQAAQQKAENDWRKYNMFMGNLKEEYKDLNEIAKQPVLTEDRDKLKQTMWEIMKGISSDPKGFFGGGAKYQETLARLAQLQSETTESKQNNLYDTAHRQFFYANPNLATPKNMALIDDYRKQPLGARNPYMLELPPMFDMKGALENLNKIAVSKTEMPGTGVLEGQNVTTVGVDPIKWNEAARALFFTGKDVKEYFTQRFEEAKKASPSSVVPYANSQNPVLDFYLDVMKGGQQAKDQTLTSNTAWQTKQQIAEQERVSKRSASTQLSIEQQSNNATRESAGWKRIDWAKVKDEKDEFGVLKYPESSVEKDQYGNYWVPGVKLQSTIDYTNRRGVKPAGIMGGDPLQFWDTQILPKIKTGDKILIKDKNGKDIPNKFTGKVEVDPLSIKGLDNILGEHIYDSEKTDAVNKLELEFNNGEVTGIIIDGHALDKDAVNAAVTNYQNKSMSQATDKQLY